VRRILIAISFLSLTMSLNAEAESEKPVCPSILQISKKNMNFRFEVLSEEKVRAISMEKEDPFQKDIVVGEDLWIYDCLYRLKKTESRGLFFEKIGRLE
jgi:hypothetical protein